MSPSTHSAVHLYFDRRSAPKLFWESIVPRIPAFSIPLSQYVASSSASNTAVAGALSWAFTFFLQVSIISGFVIPAIPWSSSSGGMLVEVSAVGSSVLVVVGVGAVSSVEDPQAVSVASARTIARVVPFRVLMLFRLKQPERYLFYRSVWG